jgi:hypothetical protein
MNTSTRDNNQVIGEIQKSGFQLLRASVGDFNARPFIYVEGFDIDAPDQLRFGLTLRPDVAEGLLGLLSKAVEVANGRRAERVEPWLAPELRTRP